jgi:hypothetical protein
MHKFQEKKIRHQRKRTEGRAPSLVCGSTRPLVTVASWALHAHMHHVGQPHLPANVFFFLTRSLRRSSSCSCIRERVVPSSQSHPRASVPTLEEEQGAQCQTASYLVVRTWLCRGRVPSTAGRARVRESCQSAERRTVSKSDDRQSAQGPIKPKIERPKNRLTQTMKTYGIKSNMRGFSLY